MNDKALILGTRGSELALCQADMVTAALKQAHPTLKVERRIIATSGDKRPDLRFSEFNEVAHVDKGIFIKELEMALESGEIDFAVHSLKDVPSDLAAGFAISAVLPRANTEDVLLTREGYTLETLPAGAKIGTSSVRRQRMIRWRRPDVQVEEIRGNVPTRVRKLFIPSHLDGILLARAGLERLGLLKGDAVELDGQRLPACILGGDDFLPAAGQGAIGIEIRAGDAATHDVLQAINDPLTLASVQAEREFLRLLGAGCQTPVGARTAMNGNDLHMRVLVFSEENVEAAPQDAEATGAMTDPLALAKKLAGMVQKS
ncbi:MAG: hydroxymethylbilane synthase [Roseimicrobium sp.]